MAWGNTGSIGSSAAGYARTLADRFDWDLMPQPRAPRTGKSRTTFNQQPHAITVKQTGSAARPEGAFTFITFLADKDVQSIIAELRGSTPTLRQLVATAPYTNAPPPSMSLVNSLVESMDSNRYFPGYLEWRNAYATELIEIWSSKVAADVGAQKANAAGDAVLATLTR
jgi:ABC-type glycerol-3-phosphate transport system substrate-binding protein